MLYANNTELSLNLPFLCYRNYQGATDIRFRWAIEIYSKTRVQRDVIFGFEDLLGR